MTRMRAKARAAAESANATPSFADLLAEIDRLRAQVAQLTERNTDLEAQMAHSKESEGPKAAARPCSSCGAAVPVSSTCVPETNEIPALPMELLLMIAKYFDPGTRSLLNFARASRNLYKMLLPLLYERLKFPGTPSSFNPPFKKRTIPCGLSHVRTLDLVNPPDMDQREWALIMCENVVELSVLCMRDCSDLDMLLQQNLERLENLTVWAGEYLEQGCLPTPMPADFPNLKQLVLKGTPSFLLAECLASCLPDLHCVHLDLDDWLPELGDLDPGFVGKIQSYKCNSTYELEHLIQVQHFRPERLEIWEQLQASDLAVLASLTSLRTLVLYNLSDSSDLFAGGLPPNIEVLESVNFMPSMDSHENLAVLRQTLRTRDVSKWRLKMTKYRLDSDSDQWIEDRLRLFVDELKI